MRSIHRAIGALALLPAMVAGILALPGPALAVPNADWRGNQSSHAVPKLDVVVYGATPSGVLAAVTAARAGARVALVEPSGHVGGMLSNGLTFTDIGDATTLGGYTREFFDRVQQAEGSAYGRFHFQPKVAELVFGQMLSEAGVAVHLLLALAPGGVTMSGKRIVSFATASGASFAASVFVDATYEGDLMAAAGVGWTIGREGKKEFNESFAGKQYPKGKMAISGVDASGRPLPPVQPSSKRPTSGPSSSRQMRSLISPTRL